IEQDAQNVSIESMDMHYDTDWKDDTDDEFDDQELEAHYIDCQHPEQSESVHNTYLLEQDTQHVSIASVDMNYDSDRIDQNDENVDLAKERELLASLIAKLKCEIDESKNRNTFLETSNKVLVEKLKSEIAYFKNKNKSLTEANNKLSEDKEIDKLIALISLSFKKIYKPTNNNLRTSSNTNRTNQDNSPRIHRNAGYESQRSGNVAGARETVAYHREKMLLCKQEEAGIRLNAEQADWKDDTDDESDDQELEAHYMYMAKIQEVSPDAVDTGPIFDKEPEQK
nr:hypothetical protein [Tanacetum cinerariifolium]